MRRQIEGIAIILFSILLTLTFETMNIKYVFDLDLYWVNIFLFIGIMGIAMVFYKPNKKEE